MENQNFEADKSKLEHFKQIEIKIEEPNRIHSAWGLSFDDSNRYLRRSYAQAVMEVCDGLGVFYQCGSINKENDTYHYFEMLGADTLSEEKAKLEALIPQIHKVAQEKHQFI